jgi:hypothetical protein
VGSIPTFGEFLLRRKTLPSLFAFIFYDPACHMCFEAEVEKVGSHLLGQENPNQDLAKYDGIATICCRRCEYPTLHLRQDFLLLLPYVRKTQFAFAVRTHRGTHCCNVFLSNMKLSEESWVIRNDLGAFLKKLVDTDQRWIRLDSSSNNSFLPYLDKDEVDCPIYSFCDLLGISAKKANDYLRATNLMEPQCRFGTLGPVLNHWESLKSEYGLEIEVEQATSVLKR